MISSPMKFFTSKVPQGFDAVGKGAHIKVGFGIFSKYSAPDFVKKLASKFSADYQLDFTINGDFRAGIIFAGSLGQSPKRVSAP